MNQPEWSRVWPCVRASEWRLFSLSLRRFSACQLLSAFMDDSLACGRCTSLHCDKREFQFSFLDLRARNYLRAKRKNADAEMDSLYHFIAASSGRQAGRQASKKSHNIKFHWRVIKSCLEKFFFVFFNANLYVALISRRFSLQFPSFLHFNDFFLLRSIFLLLLLCKARGSEARFYDDEGGDLALFPFFAWVLFQFEWLSSSSGAFIGF